MVNQRYSKLFDSQKYHDLAGHIAVVLDCTVGRIDVTIAMDTITDAAQKVASGENSSRELSEVKRMIVNYQFSALTALAILEYINNFGVKS